MKKKKIYNVMAIDRILENSMINAFLSLFFFIIFFSEKLIFYGHSGNFGNLLLIIVPAVCEQEGNPFPGSESICKSRGLSYASFSMAVIFFFLLFLLLIHVYTTFLTILFLI